MNASANRTHELPRLCPTGAKLLTSTWHASVLTLAFALPFELTAPWIDLRLLAFTDIEALSMLTLTLWVVRQVATRQVPEWRSPFTLPVALMLSALLLASIFAPSDNLHALKVTGRWFVGAAVAWMTLEAVKSGLTGRRVMQAAVLGGIIVALLVCLEAGAGAAGNTAVVAWLSPFRSQADFRVGGELRASATLAYPTITAMYLEMIFFFVVALCAKAWLQHDMRTSTLLFTVVLLVSEAIILTLTRSALIAVVLAALITVGTRWLHARLDAFARVTLLAVAGMAILVLASTLINQPMTLRLFTESDKRWYRASYTVPTLPPLRAGERVKLDVSIQNAGQRSWDAQGANAVRLTYHWLSADGAQIVGGDQQRTDLPRDVAPGDSVTVQVSLEAPAQAGRYVLAWDMLREDLFWFSVLGAPMREMSVDISPGDASTPALPTNSAPNVLAALTTDRITLWGAALQMLAAHPLLGVGPGNFRLVLGNYIDLPFWDNRLHANNMYLEQFADAGLAGGATFLLFAGILIRAAWRVLRAPSAARAYVPAAFAAALVAFLLHGVTDYFLEFTPTYLLFWLTLGTLAGMGVMGRAGHSCNA